MSVSIVTYLWMSFDGSVGGRIREKDEDGDQHDLELVPRLNKGLTDLKLLNHPVTCTALARLLNRTFKFGIGTVLSETQSFI
jgi:hypothetical protein